LFVNRAFEINVVFDQSASPFEETRIIILISRGVAEVAGPSRTAGFVQQTRQWI
jgi:hypothetical protein